MLRALSGVLGWQRPCGMARSTAWPCASSRTRGGRESGGSTRRTLCSPCFPSMHLLLRTLSMLCSAVEVVVVLRRRARRRERAGRRGWRGRRAARWGRAAAGGVREPEVAAKAAGLQDGGGGHGGLHMSE